MKLVDEPAADARDMRERFTVLRAPTDEKGRRAVARRVVEHLARHEAENNLPIGIAESIEDGQIGGEVELLVAVDAKGDTKAALVMTPPFRLVVGHGDEPVAREALLEDMLARGVVPPGVIGPEPAAADVAAWLADNANLEATRAMRQGVYKLSNVTPAERTSGTVRVATPDDTGLLVKWIAAFQAEAHAQLRTAEETVSGFLASGHRRLYLFEVEGVPVCLAGVGGRTPHGRRIGPVYTPPERRRRGYAEALVAAVSAAILADGNEFCFLFTDLDNPTSNAVYERIGYEMVIQSAEYDLALPA